MTSDDNRGVLARILRQKLESLGRAGLNEIPGSADLLARLSVQGGKPSTATATRPAKEIRPTVETPRRAPEPQPEKPSPKLTPGPVREVPPTVAAPAPAPRIAASLFEEPKLEVTVPPGERSERLATLAAEVSRCIRCPHLASTRTQTVFGEGSITARLMFVGEAPGADEDETGRPFVGRAGALLTDMITKGMGLSRDEVYIANVLKSRPPENRTPLPDEMANCLPYLEQQIAIIRPEFLCLLGKTAASALLETALPLGRLRGKWHRYRGIATIVTYHPSALLRNPAWKRDTWSDLQLLMNAMGLKAPERKRDA